MSKANFCPFPDNNTFSSEDYFYLIKVKQTNKHIYTIQVICFAWYLPTYHIQTPNTYSLLSAPRTIGGTDLLPSPYPNPSYPIFSSQEFPPSAKGEKKIKTNRMPPPPRTTSVTSTRSTTTLSLAAKHQARIAEICASTPTNSSVRLQLLRIVANECTHDRISLSLDIMIEYHGFGARMDQTRAATWIHSNVLGPVLEEMTRVHELRTRKMVREHDDLGVARDLAEGYIAADARRVSIERIWRGGIWDLSINARIGIFLFLMRGITFSQSVWFCLICK